MGALPLDHEFQENWSKLSIVEKESLLSIAKNYVQLKQENEPISLEQYNIEIEQAKSRVDSGNFIPHDQVIKDSQSWLNGK